MGHSLFSNPTCDIGEHKRQGHATLPFLKIDLRHWGPPIKGPGMGGGGSGLPQSPLNLGLSGGGIEPYNTAWPLHKAALVDAPNVSTGPAWTAIHFRLFPSGSLGLSISPDETRRINPTTPADHSPKRQRLFLFIRKAYAHSDSLPTADLEDDICTRISREGKRAILLIRRN